MVSCYCRDPVGLGSQGRLSSKTVRYEKRWFVQKSQAELGLCQSRPWRPQKCFGGTKGQGNFLILLLQHWTSGLCLTWHLAHLALLCRPLRKPPHCWALALRTTQRLQHQPVFIHPFQCAEQLRYLVPSIGGDANDDVLVDTLVRTTASLVGNPRRFSCCSSEILWPWWLGNNSMQII